MQSFLLQKINGNFKNKHILSIDQFSPHDIQKIFSYVPQMKDIVLNKESSTILAGTITALFFFEPSSRTFSSFSVAVKRLGGQTIEYQNPFQTSSAVKGETIEDTVKVFEAYANVLVMRHPQAGTLAKAAAPSAHAATTMPIINAGDGIGEHPTQALFDLYTIYETHKKLDNLTVVLAGDMLNGRTVHSIIRGLSLYKNNTVYLLAPQSLKLSREDYKNFSGRPIKLIEIDNAKDLPTNAHAWYWTRVQKERFTDTKEYEKVKHSFILTPLLIKKYAGQDTIFMHPLPRVGEIDPSVDANPKAVYLTREVKNGLYVRMALLTLVLGKIE